MNKSDVYFTKIITPERLVDIYDAIGKKLSGRVAVKVHSGEPGGNNYLKPEFMKNIVDYVGGTIVECNTAYPGRRNTTSEHWKAIKEHGFDKIADVDLMDEDGSIELPIKNSKHLGGVDYVGSHFANYDSMLVLSHFKGHMMGGFGGALKNISIGIASSDGKMWIHTAGKINKSGNFNDSFSTVQDDFLESMAEAASAVVSNKKNNIVFINVMRDISIDCDCDSNPHSPEMKDIGILASVDPIALDQACIDLIYSSKDPGKTSLIERIESKHGVHTIEYAEKLGFGSRQYHLINIDNK